MLFWGGAREFNQKSTEKSAAINPTQLSPKRPAPKQYEVLAKYVTTALVDPLRWKKLTRPCLQRQFSN
jgi:hypothetical protein